MSKSEIELTIKTYPAPSFWGCGKKYAINMRIIDSTTIQNIIKRRGGVLNFVVFASLKTKLA